MASKGKECVVCGTDYNPDIEREAQPSAPRVVATSPTISPRQDGAAKQGSAPSTSANRQPPVSVPQVADDATGAVNGTGNLQAAPCLTSDGDTLGACSQAISTTINSLSSRLTELNTRRPIPYQEVKAIAETISALADALQKVQNASMAF